MIENVNLMFSGLWLTPGRHTIELRYETPGLLYGLCLSAAGLLLFLFWVFMTRRSGKRNEAAEPEPSEAELPAEETAEVPPAESPAVETMETTSEEHPAGQEPEKPVL